MNAMLLFAVLKVLAIGNSFSVSLQSQLPSVAKALGQDLDLATMSVWGCTFDRHWACLTNAADHSYFLHWNRSGTRQADWPELASCLVKMAETADTKRGWTPKRGANLAEVIKAVKWDVITVQQGSHKSWRKETYSPCGDKLVDFIRTFAPRTRILAQETWSYTPWDKRLKDWGITPDEMAEKIHDACAGFALRHGIGRIPMGSAVQVWRRELPVRYGENSFGGDVVGGRETNGKQQFVLENGKWVPKCDVFHLNEEGCYLQALVWAATLFKVDVTACVYAPRDLAPERAALMKKVAAETSTRDVSGNGGVTLP